MQLHCLKCEENARLPFWPIFTPDVSFVMFSVAFLQEIYSHFKVARHRVTIFNVFVAVMPNNGKR
jgi:hypothetical protein